MKSLLSLLIVCGSVATLAAQQVEILSVPSFGSAGQVTGVVNGLDPATHRLTHSLYIEGGGWWTVGGSSLPIHPDGSFSIPVGTAGNDEYASHYSVAVLPVGTSAPFMAGANTLDLGPNAVSSTYRQRYGTQLEFAGRSWGAKSGPFVAGPGANVFTDSTDNVWVDQDGLHLTVQNNGGQWQSTELILPESLGYGTYLFKTDSRQDLLDANVTFGAFTWDAFGDDERIPVWPNREIDFEDSRWGDPNDVNNTQVVIQPWWIDGNTKRFALPDLSGDATLTRFFTWAPGRVEFYTLFGDHDPSDFPQSAIIDHTVLTETPQNIVPEPGRENFRFNLWLNQATPAGGDPIEVVITDFAYTGLGDFDFDGTYDCADADALVAAVAAGNASIRFDLNGDGGVDGADVETWLALAGAANLPNGQSYLPGDANLDGSVDGVDFLAWNDHKFVPTAAWCSGDFDASGVVDGQDFLVWNNHKFTSVTDGVAIPEPLVGWVWGVLAACALRRLRWSFPS